ncbi:MAG: cytochrome c biogenesis protein CcsA [Candidatus Omnitrophica bacterium]|nr:cytochrome c biogenesis protein CcsA [Candidatus Omnitrophota bacterium]
MKSASPYFIVHVAAAVVAYISFAFSFIAGLFYLYQDWQLKHRRLVKGPSLEAMERLSFNGLLIGLPVLTAALISGFIWLKMDFGTLWFWNSKLTSSVFAWLVYSVLFYFHYVSGVHGRKMVILSVCAFSLIVFIFLGMNFFEAQIHAHFEHRA